MNLRSGWDTDATSITVSGTPFIDQSHQHVDVGSFVIWNGGWLAGDASTWSLSGEIPTPDAHNMINVSGALHDVAAVPGATLFHDETAYSYVQVDGSEGARLEQRASSRSGPRELVYLRVPRTWSWSTITRELPRAVSPTTGASTFPTQPSTLTGTTYSVSAQGAGIALQLVSGGTAAIAADSDLSDPATSYRVQETPSQTPGRLCSTSSASPASARLPRWPRST